MARRLCGEENYPAALLAVAGYGLEGASRPFPEEPLDDQQWARLLEAAGTNRLTGLVMAAVVGEALPATEAQARQARAAHRVNAIRVLSLEHELITVVDLLADRGIESRVLKGAAVAHLDYADPALRSYIDIDLLVRPADIPGTVTALRAAGFTRILAEPRPGFDERFDKGTTLRSPQGYEVDLHRTFVLGPWGLQVDLEGLWDEGQELVVAGRPLRALSPRNRFVHVCYHAALGDWPLRLGSLRDVAEMLRTHEREATAVRAIAADWGVEAVVTAAIADARRLLRIRTSGELASWADRYVPSRRDEAKLGLHTRENKTFAAQAVSTLRALPRLRDKVAYARALIAPDAQYTAGRHSSMLGRLYYGIQEARRGRGALR